MRAAGFGLLLTLVPACVDIYDGDGVQGSEARSVKDFDAITTQGNLDLVVTQAAEFSIMVRIDDNLLERVSTTVSNGTLKVAIDGGNLGEFLPGPHVLIGMPELTAAELRGPGSLHADGFDASDDVSIRLFGAGILSWSGRANELAVDVEGPGELTLDGRADSASYYMRGSGTLDARDLTADEATIDVDGTGQVIATVDGPVDATAGGTSSVDLYGDVIRGNWIPIGTTATINAH